MDNILKDFLTNRELSDYLQSHELSFIAFIKTDEYTSLSQQQRITFVDSYIEWKLFINKLITLKRIEISALAVSDKNNVTLM